MNEEMSISMDQDNLYKEEAFTDRKMGTIRMMTPIKSDGTQDTARTVIFVGQAQLMTPMGALPLAFEIEAESLADAVGKYPDSAKQAVDNAMEELKELRRQQASSIVIPDGGAGAVPGAGGGKIQY